MHSYFRSIGFSKLKNKSEQNKLITTALNNATGKKEIDVGSNTRVLQFDYHFGCGLGISIIAEQDESGTISIDNSFPYCSGSHTSTQPDIQIESHSDKEAFSGISDDLYLGITLIYALQNPVDYIRSNWLNEFYKVPNKVNFGALSLDGKILYGVQLEEIAFPYEKQPISNQERRKLIAKARSGDLDAIENLTMDEMDTYSLITKRIREEDLYTVVETYFMPYGIDNEQYSIMGRIIKIEELTNEFSDELVYNLTVVCNDFILNVGINSLDLQGEPKIGRRFKGIIWLQGQVEFN